jgi:drug/metabolite transporter (DMT)-like permease
MLKYLAIPIGALVSASAQIMLKKTSGFPNWSRSWILFLFLSCALYGLSLLIYLFLLRLHPLSMLYPLTTLIVIVIVTLYGIILGEHVSTRHLIGLALGAGSICLLVA